MDKRSATPAAPTVARRFALFLAPLGAAALLGVLTAGCTGTPLGGGDGGIPPLDARRLSVIVLQTHSQFPELSGTDLPFEAWPEPPQDAARPELALRGEGVSVEPGLQSGARTRLRAALFVDKRHYAQGWLEVTLADKAAERWPIVAYELRGNPRDTFQFIYVLAQPDGQLRYLVLIGGAYEKEGAKYHGFEGTLITPGAGRDLEQWRQGYKLDFGYRLPTPPAHALKVEQAAQHFRDIRVDVERLERLRRSIAATEGELAALNAAQPTPELAARHRSAIRQQETRLEQLNLERDALVGTAEARIVAYYGLRQAIATEFAAYLEANAYLWLDADGRQQAFERWKTVEFHHPQIDEWVAAYLTHQPETAKVLDARTAAMEEIARQDNWAKDPAKARQPKPKDAPSRKQ